MSTHSILSPSGAERWSACPGSLDATRDIPNPPSKPAALGTAKHSMREWCSKNNKTAAEAALACRQKMHADGFDFEVDDDFVTHVQFALDARLKIPGLTEHEVRLDTSAILGVDGQGGTADTVVLDYEASMLTVVDDKFGWGRVKALKNKQLMIYLCAARRRYSDLFEFEKFRLCIIQPPLDAIEGLDDIYLAEDLDAFEREIRPKAVLAYELYTLNDPGMTAANLHPSDAGCQWCPIAGACTARQNKVAAQFADLTAAPPATTMTDEQLGAAMIWLEDVVTPFMAAVQAEGYARALKGQNPAGWGMYTGRAGNRAWLDSTPVAEVVNALSLTIGEEAVYQPRKLRSPTDVEKALKAAGATELYAGLEKYINRPEGKPSLQRVRTDKPPLTVAKMPEFADASPGNQEAKP